MIGDLRHQRSKYAIEILTACRDDAEVMTAGVLLSLANITGSLDQVATRKQ